MNWLETCAVVLSVVYVVLAARRSTWCWPAALVSTAIYFYICVEVQLYFESGLQVFYFAMAIYGWVVWSKGKTKEELMVMRWPVQHHVFVLVGGFFLTSLGGWLFHRYTDAALPYLDAFTTVFSLFATLLVAKKVVENWLYWIAIDVAAIFMYANRGLQLTALLFFIYTLVAIYGYMQWRRAYRTN